MELHSDGTALMNQYQSAATHDFLAYADRVAAVLHGADRMGMSVPPGIDRLRYETPQNREGESAVIYAPLSWERRGTEIPAVAREDGEPTLRFTLVRDVEGELTAEGGRTGIAFMDPAEAARDLDEADERHLGSSRDAAVAWMEYLQAYLDATMNGSFQGHVMPVAEDEDGSLYVTAGDMNQTVLRPSGEALNVGTAAVDPETGRPEPIRDRITEIREKRREEVAEMEAEAARRELME